MGFPRRMLVVVVTALALVAVAGLGGIGYASSEVTRIADSLKREQVPTAAEDQYKPGNGLSPVAVARLSGTPAGASGRVVISLGATRRSLCWKFGHLVHVRSPLSSHVHRGAPGHTGPVVVRLGRSYKASGCTQAAAVVIAAIAARPGGYYVDLHMKGGGAIRGQLVGSDAGRVS